MAQEPRVTVSFRGPGPPRALRSALHRAGIDIADPGAPSPIVLVSAARPPAPTDPERAWLWLRSAPIPAPLAAAAVRAGAYDAISLTGPGGIEQLVRRIRELAVPEPALPGAPGIIADSPRMRAILREVAQVARTPMPVLLTGETGTGKEEIARLLHGWSGRRGPWTPINCAAIPNELMESELFGHARGAFSGAIASVDGKLLAAQGGTVFLDEIDDTPLSTQMKLLRVLEEGAVTRVGETAARSADFRILAATNRDLLELSRAGRFGLDLYERLAIVRIELPRLAERPEDIPALARHFLARYYQRIAAPPQVHDIQPAALRALAQHHWPGNIRELRNVIYHALVRKRAGDELLLSDLRQLIDGRPAARPATFDPDTLRALVRGGSFNLRTAVRELESVALDEALALAQGSPTGAARLLGEVGRGRSSDPGGTVRAMRARLGRPAPE